ncbi:hypothetical protein UA08_00863 [Talaromyces atroroseus]|uniref:Cell wall proline rich protein n=1 Tax=Talaromyces atroroseus TaxID=1441469 RepID=A0A225B963_TALAT|nr:hypothetical protein UA08_00863 [Talaromyces atroroseus]OKL63936.1 hypothetical protein UA08_00863 [Talaromyces atroroseus]
MDYNPDDHDGMTMPARPPNPPFQFPARASFDATSDNVPPPLPRFSFNPGNLHAPTPSTSTLTAPRPMGHRRRPSELIGGEGPPSPRMLGTSPGANDGESANPTQPAMGAIPRGPGRRGHAHRRSQAMSSMDLTALTLSGPPTLIVGSAPTSPADNKHEFQNHIRPMSRSAIDLIPHPSPPASPAKQSSHLRSDVPIAEPRPRPVSMISTDTSSSLSTVRPNHSRVSSAVPGNRVDDSSTEAVKARPKTADATLLVSKLHKPSEPLPDTEFLRRTSLGMGPLGLRQSSQTEDVSETESIKEKKPTKKDKKKKGKKNKKRKEGETAGCEDGKKRSSTEQELGHTQEPAAEKWDSASSFNSRSGAEDGHPKILDVSHSRKQKKVRTWAGAIFPLKNKRTHAKRPLSRRSPTPPPILTRTNSDMGSIEVNFDEDNTVIIRTPTNTITPNQSSQNTTETNDTTFEASWKPRSFYEQGAENDTFSPVIDLDAALGPFNTPEMSAGRVAGSAFSQATKRMYSGGRRGEFIGPEMRYHRRAESAPEMPPFDRSVLGIFPRLDTAMANADVFYEEEEDAFLAENDSHPEGNNLVADSVDAEISSVIEEESEDELAPSSSETLQAIVSQRTPTMGLPRDDGLGIQVAEETASVDDGPGDSVFEDDGDCDDGNNNNNNSENNASLHPQVHNKKSVEIVEVDQWTHSRATHHSNSPDVSPHMIAVDKRPCSSPLDLNSGLSQLTLPSRHASSSAFPSPDPSNMSFEGPRSATASSMTDNTTFNHSLHDQRHSSFEDVPSLSSSASTRTNFRGRFSSSFYPRSSGERLESFSNPMPPRTSQSNSAKRASLVSLSRLVGGSYGERSKLSHEEKPPADEIEKTRRRSHRVSRLMFWKSKDKQNNS